MKYVYPAIFQPAEEGGYCVFFPDIGEGGTQGETVEECIEMAEDFLCGTLYDMEEDGCVIPEASNIKTIKAGDDDIITLISVDTETYRQYYENKLIKKTLNIPYLLNERAKAANINFSQLLQRALKEELHIT